MKWLPRIVLLALIVSMATPGFANNYRSAAARQKAALAQRQNRQRLALARNAAAKRQAAANQKNVATTSSTRNPSSSSQTSRGLDHDKVSRQLLGAFLLGLGGSGGGLDSSGANGQDDHQERFERQQRYNMQYWEDRARQETNAGNFSAAEQALQYAK